MKHRLEANSWREMMMKLCDICEDLYKTNQPIQIGQPTNPTQEPKKDSMKSLFDQLGKEGEKK